MNQEQKKPLVVVTGRIREQALQALQEQCTVKQWDKKEVMPDDLLIDWLEEADGLYLVRHSLDEHHLVKAKSLKVVAQSSVGYDNVNVDALTERGIPFGNTPQVLDESVAELAMGLTVCASRRIVEQFDFIKDGLWAEKKTPPKGFDLSRCTMGIIGMGNIGVSISRRARAFGMTVIYHNRHRRKDDHLYKTTYATLDELLEQSDVVMSVLPLTESTEGMIGREEFKKMKSSALFVNVGRGKVVQTDALVEALETGEIDYAALDVVDPEPIGSDHPLLQTGKCLITPHIASFTDRTRITMALLTAENIIQGVQEQPLTTCINEEVNYSEKG